MRIKSVPRVVAVGALLIATMAIGPVSRAVTGQGKIETPTYEVIGVTELEHSLDNCEGTPTTQGVDGWVIDVHNYDTLTVTGTNLTPAPPVGQTRPLSLSLVFLNSNCFPASFRPNVGTSETVTVTNYQEAIVELYYGAHVRIDWDLTVIP